jgi:hypothetical protein
MDGEVSFYDFLEREIANFISEGPSILESASCVALVNYVLTVLQTFHFSKLVKRDWSKLKQDLSGTQMMILELRVSRYEE